MLHPDFPVVEGHYRLTEDWEATLPVKLNRRIEDGALVLWRPGFTLWLNIWGNDHQQTPQSRCERAMRDASHDAYAQRVVEHGGNVWLAYRLQESHAEFSLYAFAFAASGHIQAAIYFENESDLELAEQIWLSFVSSGASS